MQNFFSGLSGLAIPFPRYTYPEPFRSTSRLTYYSSLFRSIEINRLLQLEQLLISIRECNTDQQWRLAVEFMA